MKITIEKNEIAKSEYPCIKELKYEGNQTIVLFTGIRKGVCLYNNNEPINDSTRTGCFHSEWNETYFIPFKGQITLEND